MNDKKISFYNELLKMLKAYSEKGTVAYDYINRANLACLAEILPEDEFDDFISRIKDLDQNEWCFEIYTPLHDNYLEMIKDEKESTKELDSWRNLEIIVLHIFKDLDKFECIPFEKFPSWFEDTEKE